MPQLVKGGKWVFGWVTIGQDCKIQIPEAAFREYGFQTGERIVFTKGSRRSGGFGIGHVYFVYRSVAMKARVFSAGEIDNDMRIQLPDELGMTPGLRLLAYRGSSYALGFLMQGPIIDEALKHPEIEA